MSAAATPPSLRCAQVVLAAGRSSRMGEPKALLEFGDRRAIELVLDAATSAGVGRSIVVVAPAGEGWRRLPELASRDIDWVLNEKPDAEQIDSLARGIERVLEIERSEGGAIDGIFVHPVDYPLASERDYEALLDAAKQAGNASVEVFKPRFGARHGHPILVRRGLFEWFVAAAAAGETARDVVRRAEVRSVEVADSGAIDDMDTPEDYARLRERFERE